VLSLAKPTAGTLDALVRDQRDAPFSYPDVGATRTTLPPGYRHGRHVVQLGHGEATFARAVDGLRRWQAHVGADVEVSPSDAPLLADTVVALVVHRGPLYVTVACRIAYLIEEAARFGFAYGTLPHHLIEGEESFVVERDERDAVRFVITSFVRPRRRLLRLVAPLVNEMDQRLVRRYLHAMQHHAGEQE
jgi:uncharacterized protein (UPF0548 family)